MVSLDMKGGSYDLLMEGLRKTTKHLRQDSRSPSCNSNQVPLKYKFRELPLHETAQWNSIIYFTKSYYQTCHY